MTQEANSNREAHRDQFAIMEQIVDKARSDPKWKGKLIDDPTSAFKEAGLLTDEDDPATADVVGQITQNEYLYLLVLISIAASKTKTKG